MAFAAAAAAATDTVDVAAQERGHLDNKLLMKLAVHELTSKEQFSLGVQLEMEPSTIRQLMCEEEVTSTFAILEAWRNSRKSSGNYSASYDQLCEAYLELKRTDIAENIRREQTRLAKEELGQSRAELVSYKQKYDEQTRLAKEELGQSRAELVSYKQKHEEDLRHSNEKVRVLKDEAQESKDQLARAKDAFGKELLKMKTTAEEEIRRLTELISVLKTEVQMYKQAFEGTSVPRTGAVALRGTETQWSSVRVVAMNSPGWNDENVVRPKVRQRKSHEIKPKPRDEEIIEMIQKLKGGYNKKATVLRVMQLLRKFKEPKLWHQFSSLIVSDGELDISKVVTATTLPDVEYLLSSGEARDVISLNVGYNRIFEDTYNVRSLCQGLERMPKLRKLKLNQCALRDHGFSIVCDTIMTYCQLMTWLDCSENPGMNLKPRHTYGVDELSPGTVRDIANTLTRLSDLTIYIRQCSLECKGLRMKFGGRIVV